MNRQAWHGGWERHATLKGARGPRMSEHETKRARGRDRTGWMTSWSWAVVGSSIVHALVLGGLWRGSIRQLGAAEPEPVSIELKTDPSAWDKHAPTDPLDEPPLPPLPTVDEAVVVRPLDAPEGERDN